MKIKNLIAGLILSSIMGVGVFTGLSNGAGVKAKEVGAVDAGTVIYLDVSACNWFSDNAKVAIWNHGGSVWNEFTSDSASGLYKTTISPSCTSFNLFRGSALNWNNKWNQSDDASFSSGKNKIIAAAYSNNKMMFSWGNYAPALSAPTISKSGNVISWTAVSNASGYKVNVDGTDVATLGSGTTSYTFDSHKAGSHTLKVLAKGDGTNYSDSPYSNSVSISVAEGYYLVGTFNNWVTTGDSGEIKATTSSGVHTVSITTTAADVAVKLVKFPSGMTNIKWYSSVDADSEFAYPVSVDGSANIVLHEIGAYTIQVSNCDDDHSNAKYTITSNPYVSPYSVTIGSETVALTSVKKDTNDEQYKAHFNSVTSGQSISFKKNSSAQAATAEANDSDNADSINNIILQNASNVDVYLKKNGNDWTYYVSGRTSKFFISVWPSFYAMTQNPEAATGNYMYTGLELAANTELKLFCTTYYVPSEANFEQQSGLGFELTASVIRCTKAGTYNFFIDDTTGSDAKLYIGGQSEADIKATKFANDFLDAFQNGDGHSGICVADGSTSTSLISSTWTTLNTNYTTNVNPNADAKSILKNADRTATTVYGKFAALYDTIYNKYGTQLSLTNYAARTTTNGRVIQPVFSTQNSIDTIIVVVVVSLVAVSAIGGYFFLRKRKED